MRDNYIKIRIFEKFKNYKKLVLRKSKISFFIFKTNITFIKIENIKRDLKIKKSIKVSILNGLKNFFEQNKKTNKTRKSKISLFIYKF